MDLRTVERCVSGEAAAWEILVESQERSVFNACYRFTRSNSDAEDLTQEVFLRVLRTVRTFRAGEGSFQTWMSRLTRNLLIDHYRRRRQDRITVPLLKDRCGGCLAPEATVLAREGRERLRGCLERLSPELRETHLLREVEEMDYRQIADRLGIPEGTVKSRLNRARAELKRRARIHY